VRNNERYLAFYPAVPQAFLEVSDLRAQFFLFKDMVNGRRAAARAATLRLKSYYV
jgi:hypothetical protein